MKPSLPLLAACAVLQTLPAAATSFEFVPAPQTDLNRMYRVDKVTGEVTSCQYGLQESAGESARRSASGRARVPGPRPRRNTGWWRAATPAKQGSSG